MSLLWGFLAAPSSQRCEAFRAASDLVQVRQERESKHGKSDGGCASRAEIFEMKSDGGGCGLMTKASSRSRWALVAEAEVRRRSV
jgi:hypothetical protein